MRVYLTPLKRRSENFDTWAPEKFHNKIGPA